MKSHFSKRWINVTHVKVKIQSALTNTLGNLMDKNSKVSYDTGREIVLNIPQQTGIPSGI